VARFFTSGWLTQPSSGYGKDYPEATWLYRMKAVQAACAAAFVGAPILCRGMRVWGIQLLQSTRSCKCRLWFNEVVFLSKPSKTVQHETFTSISTDLGSFFAW